ncbi:hypothetical protein PsYK624_137290 [Phanerochaete sordida]|uniref:Uncharacterized protein n=1 Tax=Phanerochaete sordida TaxID=48140 RepID=A0A9P3GM71_9APHY|nr:hypothetical protein PsYK624_137290 [Phanerochaete sordida]
MCFGPLFHQGAVIAASLRAENDGWLCADVDLFLVPTSIGAGRAPSQGSLPSRTAGPFESSQYGGQDAGVNSESSRIAGVLVTAPREFLP